MNVISNYFSYDRTKQAIVNILDSIPVVEFYQDNIKLETRVLIGLTLQQAEDIAVNYIQGTFKI
jgi:hypothetical protein